MDPKTFIANYREAFGASTDLPIAFGYADEPAAATEKINGCFFKCIGGVSEGRPVSLNADVIGCGGGKFYTGFTGMPEHVPAFVSHKEHYKRTPQMVLDFIDRLDVPRSWKAWLNLNRLDRLDSFDGIEGLLFLATPDMLSGLTSWAFYDSNSADAVTALFGSGCSAIVTQTVVENRRGGDRTFLGLFDPSVRPYVGENVLSFAIPMSRFRTMYGTMRESCLFGTHAWDKVRDRINRLRE